MSESEGRTISHVGVIVKDPEARKWLVVEAYGRNVVATPLADALQPYARRGRSDTALAGSGTVASVKSRKPISMILRRLRAVLWDVAMMTRSAGDPTSSIAPNLYILLPRTSQACDTYLSRVDDIQEPNYARTDASLVQYFER